MMQSRRSLPNDDMNKRSVINLGCGTKRLPDAVNVDLTRATSPDVVHNLNCRPWPFPDYSFDEIIFTDVIEHLDDIVGTVEETYRIARNRALVRITVPHFSSANAFTDPTHRHYFGWHSLDYFTGKHEHSYYTQARFIMQSRKLFFYPSLLNKVVRRLANRWPAVYERRWAWIFPAWFLAFDLTVVKSEFAQYSPDSPLPSTAE